MHLAVLLWGFTGILGKAISLSAPVLVWYRMLLATLIIALILTVRKKWISIQRKDLRQLIIIGILFAIHWVAFYASVKLANAAIAMVCLATSSVFTAILDPLIHKRKFNRSEIGLSMLAVAGVLCIYLLQPDTANRENSMENFQLGIGLGMVAAIISAAFSVFNKPLAEKYPARPLVFYEMLSGLAFLTVLAPFFIQWRPEAVLLPQGWDYLWIFLLSYCCTVWGQSLAMAALKHLSAFTTTLSVNLEPVYGIVLAFLIYQENEQLGPGFYLGMSLIFLSVALQVMASIRNGRRARRILPR